MYLLKKKKKAAKVEMVKGKGKVLKVPTAGKEKSWIWSMDWGQFHGSNNGLWQGR